MKKTRWSLLAAALSVVGLATFWVLAPEWATRGSAPDAAGRRAIPQAAWEVKAYAAPNADGITRADRQVFQRERDEVVGLIQRLYEALFLRPGEVDRVVRRSLSPPASKALSESRMGLHEGVEDVRTTARFVRIGIQSDGGLRAAAVVRVEAHALRRSSPVEIWHRARLWMEKTPGGWKVVAFDAEQGRLP